MFCSVWDISDGTSRDIKHHTDAILCVKWIDDDTFACCSKDKTISVWNNDTKECIFTLEGHGDWVKSIAVNHSNNTLSK